MTIHTTPRVADHDIADLFLRRWSPRAFSGERISDEALSSLFEAARWAPSSSNSQPWRFIYAHRGTAQFNRIISTINPRNQRWAKDASVLVALLSKRAQQGPGQDAPAPLRNHSLDAGAAWAHLALQATHSGWIAHAIGGFEAADARRELAIPETRRWCPTRVGKKTFFAFFSLKGLYFFRKIFFPFNTRWNEKKVQNNCSN